MIDETRMEAIRKALMTLEESARGQRLPGGALYVVATPIGNLADITVRALVVLHAADLIACEDTRNAGGFLDRLGIRTELLACHEHNEREAAVRIIERLAGGAHVALISDAGTPAVSDPGARLVDAVRAAGYAVIPIPGASAVATAVSVAGFTESAFYFGGFLPARSQAREQALGALIAVPASLVLYEAPHRVVETIDALARVLGTHRKVVIARELTKLHEQIHTTTLGEAAAWIAEDANRTRGEFVFVVEGAPHAAPVEGASLDRVLNPLLGELPLKQAVSLAVAITGTPRNAVYARALELKAASEAQ